jgi:para-aminobenzoate synthetase component 1
LARELARFPQGDSAGPVPFIGGAVGFLGYELAHHLEIVPSATTGRFDTPDMVSGFTDLVLAFDAQTHRAWLLSSGLPRAEGPAR